MGRRQRCAGRIVPTSEAIDRSGGPESISDQRLNVPISRSQGDAADILIGDGRKNGAVDPRMCAGARAACIDRIGASQGIRNRGRHLIGVGAVTRRADKIVGSDRKPSREPTRSREVDDLGNAQAVRRVRNHRRGCIGDCDGCAARRPDTLLKLTDKASHRAIVGRSALDGFRQGI